jgi:hypothetical protein
MVKLCCCQWLCTAYAGKSSIGVSRGIASLVFNGHVRRVRSIVHAQLS